MSDTPRTRTVWVSNRQGLHARAAVMVAELARRFRSRIELVTKDGRRVTSTDVLQILSLGCAQGEPLDVVVDGDDAEAAIEAVSQLFASRFGEDRDPETATDAT